MANCPSGSNHRDWIEYYVKELGWSLIPVNENKIPVLKEWNKYRNEPLSIDMLLYYVEQRGLGLGSITGEKTFYVIDDDYPKHPEATKPEWYSSIASPMMCRTQHGGIHHYFKPFNIANKQNIKQSNGETLQIDLRGSNGQVLVPPFFGYTWITPPTVELYKSIPGKEAVPEELITLFTTGKQLNHEYIGTDDFFEVLGASTHRDPILFERSFVLWQNHIKDPTAYPPERIASILADFNNQFNPPKDANTVAKCYEQGKRYAFSMAKTEGEISIEEPELLDINTIESVSQLEIINYPRIKVGLPKFAEGIPSGMNLIIGTPGSGKSWFAIWLIQRIWELNRLRSVFFSLEMDRNGLMKRILQSYSNMTLEQFESGMDTTVGLNRAKETGLIICDYSKMESSSITPNQFVSQVHSFYRKGIRVFFFDHLHELSGATVSSKNQDVLEVWGDAFKLIRNTYNDVWLFILVQPNKEAYKKTTLTKESTSGSTSIINKCDFFLSINRTEDPDAKDEEQNLDKPVRIWVDKNRRGAMDRVGQEVLLTPSGHFVPVEDVFEVKK